MMEKLLSFAVKAAVLAAGVVLAMEAIDFRRRREESRYITTCTFADEDDD